MKKVLILAYDFPPYVSVGGLRPYAWYKYFKEFGLYPVVVTRQWDNKYGNELDYIAPSKSTKTIVEETEYGTIIRTPYKPNLSNRLLLKYGNSKFSLIRKIITAYYEIMQFFFFIGTKSGLYFGAKDYLKNNKVDAIIATGDPYVLFKYASKLSNTYNIPWIADYRDPWVQDKQNQKSELRFTFEKYLERKFVNKSTGVTSVSSLFLNLIKSNINSRIPSGIFINGFDENNIQEKALLKNTDDLIITYAGSLYMWHPLEETIQTINKSLERGVQIQLRFIGCNHQDRLEKALSQAPLVKQHTQVLPKLSNKELMQELQKTHLLLLFNDYSISGTKIYDYLAVKKPVLLCFSDDKESKALKDKYFHLSPLNGESEELQYEILKNTDGGQFVKDKNHLNNIIQDYWTELQSTGTIAFQSKNVEQYSRKATSGQLVSFINKIIQQ